MIKKGLCIRIYLAEICKRDSSDVIWKYDVRFSNFNLTSGFVSSIIQGIFCHEQMNKQTSYGVFDIYLQGKWMGFQIDSFLTLNFNLTLVCFRTITSFQHQAQGCWTAKRAATVRRTTWRWPWQIHITDEGDLSWQIHQKPKQILGGLLCSYLFNMANTFQ